MLQLLDLANENAALKRELARIRQEAEALRLLLLSAGASEDDGASESPRRLIEEEV
jgi:alkylation response protein AidB-like acyl-CoA dehydrogenase